MGWFLATREGLVGRRRVWICHHTHHAHDGMHAAAVHSNRTCWIYTDRKQALCLLINARCVTMCYNIRHNIRHLRGRSRWRRGMVLSHMASLLLTTIAQICTLLTRAVTRRHAPCFNPRPQTTTYATTRIPRTRPGRSPSPHSAVPLPGQREATAIAHDSHTR